MKKYAIEVNSLSKKYRYGQTQLYHTIRESINEMVSSTKEVLFNKSKRLKKDEFWALKNISFKVKEGEIIGIIGPNGAGKSTLLKALSQITPPSSGEIILRGRVGSLLEVGTGFHPELTGRENIYLNGAILGMTRKEINKKFDEIVDFAEIEQFIDTPVKRYSSGMYVRLAFSVAAQLEPEILLVDEVLSVGDIFFQKKSLGKIQDISQSGKTIILVSHSLGTVQKICKRVLLIDKGKLVADGPADKILNIYRNTGNVDTEGPIKIYKINKKLVGQHLKLTLVNEKMKPTTLFKLGERAFAIVDFTIRKPIKNADVAVMISQAGGPLWVGLDTDATPSLLTDRRAGEYRQVVELPLHILMPGNYHLGPSMGYVGVGPIDRQYFNGVNFEITNISINPKHRIQKQEKGGVISYIQEWKNLKIIKP